MLSKIIDFFEIVIIGLAKGLGFSLGVIIVFYIDEYISKRK